MFGVMSSAQSKNGLECVFPGVGMTPIEDPFRRLFISTHEKPGGPISM
jgi:hypothetical protein